MDPTAPDDEAAADGVARARTAALVRQLADGHRDFLSFLQRRVGSRQIAEDILQEAFARGVDRIERLREGESAVAWFYRVLRNAVIDHHRREGASARALAAFAAEVEQHEQPTDDLRGAVCGCVGRLAETLKPDYADALRRIEIDGVAVKEFAEERGITSSNAAVRVFRAREALRRQVVASCGTCAEHGCVACTCVRP